MFQLAFWIFILFLALSFFGISVKGIIESPAGQENLAYLIYLIVSGWHWLIQYVLQLKLELQGI